jgi:hypothetical protein
MAASPRACGLSATPICASLAWAAGDAVFRASVFSALNAIVGAALARNYTGNARPTTTTLWPKASFMYAVAPSVLGKSWLWTLSYGYHEDRKSRAL